MAKRPSRPPSPETRALQHLAELAQRATDPGRVRRAVEAMVANWLTDTPLAERELIHDRVTDLHTALAEAWTPLRRSGFWLRCKRRATPLRQRGYSWPERQPWPFLWLTRLTPVPVPRP